MTDQLDQHTILVALQTGEITLQGQFLNSSNDTFLGSLEHEDLKLPVVYKPTRGERPLWDFPSHTLTKREVAAFFVSEALGWSLVPPTVYRRHNTPAGAGSLQLFIEHDPEYHYFTFSQADRQRLRPVVLFDLLVNNADRKGGHILVDRNHHLWLIDHGICFHQDNKLRTVIWDFSAEEIPPALKADIQRFYLELNGCGNIYLQLRSLLRPAEIDALVARACRLVKMEFFLSPNNIDRPFPWPPI